MGAFSDNRNNLLCGLSAGAYAIRIYFLLSHVELRDNAQSVLNAALNWQCVKGI